MLVAAEQEAIQSGGLQEGNTFTIAASSKAFEILSSNLYQNKILAVIREISCNAADAHKVAGKPLSAINVSLPSHMKPTFSVRDYGPGLSHRDVLTLYTTYFSSTKDASNDLIGGFGLGSKSPFAVADQFTITVWQGGECRRYVCFKDSGVPNINFIGASPSTEPDGLEVLVSVKTAAIYDWQTNAAQYFKWWPTLPKGITDVTPAYASDKVVIASPNKVGDFPEWAVLPTGQPATVVMGLVPYSLSLEALPATPILSAFRQVPLLLAFGMGEVSISPSREALSYDPKTCAAILARLTAIHSAAQQTVIDKIASATSLYEARRVYKDTVKGSSLVSLLGRNSAVTSITWNGKPIHDSAVVDLSQPTKTLPVVVKYPDARVSNYNKSSYRKKWVRNTSSDSTRAAHAFQDYEGTIQCYYWTATPSSKTYRTISHYLEETYPTIAITRYGGTHTEKPSYNTTVVWGLPFADAQKLFEEKGFPPLIDVSTLPEPPKAAPGTPGARAPKTTGYTYKEGSWDRTETAIDLSVPPGATKPRYYVEFYNGDAEGFASSHALYELRRIGWLKDVPIIGLSKSRLKVKKLTDDLDANGWQLLTAAFVHTIPDALVEKQSFDDTLCHVVRTEDFSRMQTLCNRLDIVSRTKFGVDAIYKVTTGVSRNYTSYLTPSLVTLLSPTQLVAVKTGKDRAIAFGKVCSDYLDKHPLLRHLNVSDVDISLLLDYTSR